MVAEDHSSLTFGRALIDGPGDESNAFPRAVIVKDILKPERLNEAHLSRCNVPTRLPRRDFALKPFRGASTRCENTPREYFAVVRGAFAGLHKQNIH
jgi:hypothetical protein